MGLGLGVGVGLIGRVGEHRERALGKVLEHADLWLGRGLGLGLGLRVRAEG